MRHCGGNDLCAVVLEFLRVATRSVPIAVDHRECAEQAAVLSKKWNQLEVAKSEVLGEIAERGAIAPRIAHTDTAMLMIGEPKDTLVTSRLAEERALRVGHTMGQNREQSFNVLVVEHEEPHISACK
jgi:hypothetical protein